MALSTAQKAQLKVIFQIFSALPITGYTDLPAYQDFIGAADDNALAELARLNAAAQEVLQTKIIQMQATIVNATAGAAKAQNDLATMQS